MGFQVGASCYGDALSAVQAVASSEVGRVVPAGSAVYVVDVLGVTEASITYELSPITGGTALTMTAPISVQPCGLLDWSDGLFLGWAVAGVWLATFAVLHLRAAAHR